MLEGLKPQATGKGIKDYLIMPIQRIPRYQMLLHELVKATWKSHADYNNLVQAQQKVQEVAITLENQSADASSIARVMELSSVFSRKDNFKLLVPHRRYIDDTMCTATFPENSNNPIQLGIFLFNDLIIWTKAKKEKYTVKKIIDLTTATVNPSSGEDGKFSFECDNEEVTMVIDKDKHTKWVEYFTSISKGQKIWLPHAIEKEDGIISVQQKEPLVPTPPPLTMHTKKKRSILGGFAFLKSSQSSTNRDDLESIRKVKRTDTGITDEKAAENIYPMPLIAAKSDSSLTSPRDHANEDSSLDGASPLTTPAKTHQNTTDISDITKDNPVLASPGRARSNARVFDMDALNQIMTLSEIPVDDLLTIPPPPPIEGFTEKFKKPSNPQEDDSDTTKQPVKTKTNINDPSSPSTEESTKSLERKLGQKKSDARETLLNDIKAVKVDDNGEQVVTSSPKPSRLRKSKKPTKHREKEKEKEKEREKEEEKEKEKAAMDNSNQDLVPQLEEKAMPSSTQRPMDSTEEKDKSPQELTTNPSAATNSDTLNDKVSTTPEIVSEVSKESLAESMEKIPKRISKNKARKARRHKTSSISCKPKKHRKSNHGLQQQLQIFLTAKLFNLLVSESLTVRLQLRLLMNLLKPMIQILRKIVREHWKP